MKEIQSNGGPFIGLDKAALKQWGGAFGKTFTDPSSPFDTDYDGCCSLTRNPALIAKLQGQEHEAILLTEPMITALIDRSATLIRIAQVWYAEDSWTFDNVEERYYRQADFNQEITYTASGSGLVLFDAANDSDIADTDCLQCEMQAGRWIARAATFYPDKLTHLNLFELSFLA